MSRAHLRLRRCTLLLVLALSPLVLACGAVEDSGPAEEATQDAGPPSDGLARARGNEPGDRGDFQMVYEPVENAGYRELEEVFKETRLLDDTLKDLNDTFKLPTDVAVALEECGEPNAFYQPDRRRISVCYELVDYFTEMFTADTQDEQEAEEAGVAVAGATMFVFFHELGHALIHLYELPITGREEDAVDQLATLILLEGGEEGEDAALDGATSFLPDEEAQELDDLAFWDEHSLGEQRFYNILCWSYGKNPQGLQELVEDEVLPVERAERCEAEYQQMAQSWETLLAAHMKE